MLQGSLQKIDFQDLLPDLTFQLRDSRLLRPFLAYAGKRPLPKLIDIAAPAVQFLAAHLLRATKPAGSPARNRCTAPSLNSLVNFLRDPIPISPFAAF